MIATKILASGRYGDLFFFRILPRVIEDGLIEFKKLLAADLILPIKIGIFLIRKRMDIV